MCELTSWSYRVISRHRRQDAAFFRLSFFFFFFFYIFFGGVGGTNLIEGNIVCKYANFSWVLSSFPSHLFLL